MKRLHLVHIGLITGLLGSLAAQDNQTTTVGVWRKSLIVKTPMVAAESPLIRASLDQKISVDFQAATLQEACDFLHRASACNFVIVKAPENVQITLKLHDVRMGTVLEWMRRQAGVPYAIRDEAIVFGNDTDSGKESSVTLVDVSDLLMPIPNFVAPELGMSNQGGQVLALPQEAPAAAPNADIETLAKMVQDLLSGQ
jgi:hypothetical protein